MVAGAAEYSMQSTNPLRGQHHSSLMPGKSEIVIDFREVAIDGRRSSNQLALCTEPLLQRNQCAEYGSEHKVIVLTSRTVSGALIQEGR